MTTIPPALAEHLGGDATSLCHCWRLTRTDGAVFGFTDHDRALTVDGTTFEAATGLAASEARDTLGLAADAQDVEGALSSLAIGEDEIVAGLYDGATVETLLVNWQGPEDFAHLRTAVLGKVTRRDGGFAAELESLTHGLDQPNGRVVRRECDAELGDARCGFDLDQAGFHGEGSVVSVEAEGIVVVAGLDAFSGGWFANGLLTWSTGESAGRTERVVDHGTGPGGVRLVLWHEGGAAIAAGDIFTLVAGCDKRFATCKAKFDNAANFRGFPHLPGNDAAYGYVTEGGVFDGGPLVE